MQLELKLPNPIFIDRAEVFRWRDQTFVRVTSRDKQVGTAIAGDLFPHVRPTLLNESIRYFVNKDARDLSKLIDELETDDRFLPLRGLNVWPAVAPVELAILDLLGQAAEKPVTELLGGMLRLELPVCLTSSRRAQFVEVEVRTMSEKLAVTGAKAVKLRALATPGDDLRTIITKTDKLLAAARKAWGNEIVLYVDAGAKFEREDAIEFSQLLKAWDVALIENPCRPDDFLGARAVTDAVGIRVAWGRYESSLARWRWAVEHTQADVFTPDVQLVGGLCRASDMADETNAAGLLVSPRCGAGTLDVIAAMHLASRTRSVGPFFEIDIERHGAAWCTPAIHVIDGVVATPTGPGLGIDYEPHIWRETSQVLT